jgi:CRISPR-associated exonuclease Cas4
VERKKHVSRIYDGYVFQLYGQYYSMIDMGYAVDSLRIHSIDDNKNYNIDLPENDKDMKNRFEQLISDMRAFDMDKFVQENSQKCANCIYEDACDRSVSRGD